MFREDEHIDHKVDDALHGLLTAQENARVERHAAACDRCALALEQARQRLGLLRSLPVAEPSATLVPTTLGAIEGHTIRRRMLGRRAALASLTALAAAVIVLAGLQIYYSQLKPNSIDLIVLGQRELLARSPAVLRVMLTDRGKKQGLSGMPIVVALLSPDGTSRELARTTTDAEGSAAPRFEVPDIESGPYQLRVIAGAGPTQEVLTRAVQVKRSCKLMLTTDRPVYQPGQKILIRSLALRLPDLRPFADQLATYTLTDPRGNVLFKQSPMTSAYGISSAECALDPEILEGTYTIGCTIASNERVHATSNLSVEIKRYVLPKFQIRLALDRPFYAPGSHAQLQVDASYFFGKPVVGGEVSVFVRDSLPGESAPVPQTARTNDKGMARLSIPLPKLFVARPEGGMRVGGDSTLKLLVKVRDSAGQEYTRSIDCLMTSMPIRVEAIAEAGTLVRTQTNTVYLLVRQANGVPIPRARLEIRRCTMQGDMGDIIARVQADASGTATWQITPELMQELATPGDAGALPFWVAVVDAGGGRLARQAMRLPLGAETGDFLVRLDRAVYQAGQSMTITALGSGVEPVFIDLIREGQTYLSDKIEMKDGKGELVIDLPAEVTGTLQLVAYRFNPADGLPRRKLRVVQILRPGGVKVTARLDAKQYRPGGSAVLNVQLSDDKGKPITGAVSLSAVDEAVFSVLTQRPGMEKTFFSLEQDLLKPVYAIYPSWTPSERPDVQRLDRALLASTSLGLDTSTEKAARHLGSPRTPQVREVGPYTMAVRTLPIKQEQTNALRQRRLEAVYTGWVALILSTLLAGYVALWLCLPVGLMLKLHGIAMLGLLLLITGTVTLMLLTGGKSAREFAEMSDQFMSFAVGAKSKQAMAPDGAPGMAGDVSNPRVRNYFPETLLWKPELITDDHGKLTPITIPLADSITQWRLSASAVARDGRLGSTQLPISVFQPFFVDLNLPVAMTRGDEVGVPVVVYNYSDRKQTVKLTLAQPGKAWFSLTGPAEQTLELAPGEVRSTRYPIRVTRIGKHKLQMTAIGGTVSDALVRDIEVVPDGRRVETTFSGSLDRPAEVVLNVPPEAIEGSVHALVKFYPSGFSQLVEGLDSIFQMPHGCFEQTSSSTYPNVLALDYLRSHHLNLPEVEAKARQYIHLGYQRLVGFEVSGGGFDWYGQSPAKLNLTAYGLMEFQDMARVHDVDPRLIERTRRWLLQQRQNDGSWKTERMGSHLTGSQGEQANLATTAYIAWAIYGSGKATVADYVSMAYLLGHRPSDIADPHTLALVANALSALDPSGEAARPYVDRLVELGTAEEGGRLFWKKGTQSRTVFYGAGISADVETTALAALALIPGRAHPEQVRGALSWLIAKKDPSGTWYSTQATILALKALIAGSKVSTEKRADRQAKLAVGDHREDVVTQADVLKWVNITPHLKTPTTRVDLRELTKSGMSYQVVLRYHVPQAKKAEDKAPLAISLAYDRTELAINETIRVKARVVNRQTEEAPMVMLDLPIPPGFAARSEEFEQMVKSQRIGRYQIRPRSVLVYLRGLQPEQPLELEYVLQALMVVRAKVPPARVYEYYDPQKNSQSQPVQVTVKVK